MCYLAHLCILIAQRASTLHVNPEFITAVIKVKLSIKAEFTDQDCGDVCCCTRSLVVVQWRASAVGHVTHHVAGNQRLTR